MISVLTLLEARVLGVLMEKERTVPDSYPLTLNALVSGCNQKTSRDPLIATTESEVLGAIDSLRAMSLVIESSGSRVQRYSHNFERVLKVPRQASALLAVLMLRGPQTAGELRTNCERLHAFSDISSVEGFLHELRDRADGGLVTELPRQPGSRENRWMHLLSGAPDVQAPTAGLAAPRPTDLGASEIANLKAAVARLEGEMSELKALVARLCADRGNRP
jgi:uncharacterized protein YceH (UPF0502 family)